MSTFGYRRGLSKYESIDEDELLASLTAEELKELERELEDIEPDRNLPVGLRQKSLTEKTPTGNFSREALMAYWEKESQKLLEKERLGECGKVAEEDKEESEEELIFTESNSEVSEEVYTEEEEAEEEEEGEEEEEEEEEEDDSHEEESAVEDEEAINGTARPERASPDSARPKTFKSHESNFVTGKGVLALMRALQHNPVLTELRFHNQRHIMGSQVEMEIVKLLRDNTTLLRLGYHFELPGPRMSMTSLLTRNMDLQRQRLPPPPPPPPPPLPEKKLITRNIAEVIKQQESAQRALQNGQKKKKGKKGKKQPKNVLKEIKNSLRPVQEKKAEDSYRPSTPQRSAHDNLMEAIRGSSLRQLRRVEVPDALR
ncbi:PREDICTED: leiomodin-2 [Myotis davidii]|uniref:leiomodin-2 n=1 Tax=Myotis davidii TaxID=225400 RepID=UPI0003EBDC47|nr:PREDICTED: leiomodin-2 [Myotis davidii]